MTHPQNNSSHHFSSIFHLNLNSEQREREGEAPNQALPVWRGRRKPQSKREAFLFCALPGFQRPRLSISGFKEYYFSGI